MSSVNSTTEENTSFDQKDENQELANIITSATGNIFEYKEQIKRFDCTENGHSTTEESNLQYKNPIPKFPKNIPFTYRNDVASFHALQEWEGYVTDIHEDTFEAELTDLTNTDPSLVEIATIYKSELSENDLQLLEIDAVFRWSIGYEIRPSGTKQRVSKITFRRLPLWKKSDFDQAKKIAKNLIENAKWE